MTLSIVENLSASFEFAKDGLVDHWDRWIILMLLLGISYIIEFGTTFVDTLSVLFMILLIVSVIASLIGVCIASGYLVKIFRGGEVAPELEGYFEMFIDGIKLCIIQFVYLFIPIMILSAGILFAGLGGIALLATGEVPDATAVAMGMGITGLLLMLGGIVLLIILGLIATIAGIRFAKTEKLGEGFNFEEIFATIKEIGWLHYILSYIVFIILVGFLTFLLIMIMEVIPFIGWVPLVIITPLLFLWQGKFLENLYSCA